MVRYLYPSVPDRSSSVRGKSEQRITMNCKKCHFPLKPEQADKPCPQCGSLDRDLGAWGQAVFSDKARAAKELAMKHYQVEPGLTQIIRFSGSPQLEATPVEP